MSLEKQKESAVTFLKNFEHPDPKVFENLLADNFEFEMMGRLPGVSPVRGKEVFIKQMSQTLKAMFPNGLNLKFSTIIAEGAQVAVQCESDTTAANGKKYANRYHFYFRFAGDKIEQAREYNDVNHVREVFMS